jgi:SAM-dependent methyltransferase
MPRHRRREQERRDLDADEYDQWYLENKGPLFERMERELFARAVPEGARRVVDLGSGTGRISSAIGAPGRRVVATDLSPASLTVLAGKDLSGVAAACSDLTTLPFRDGAFDAGVSCQVLQHLRFDDLLKALREIRRVLAPGSPLVFSVYNLHYWGYGGVIELGEEHGTYHRRFTEGTIRHLAATTGWRVVRIGYYKALRFRRLSSERWTGVDRLIGATPGARKMLCAYLLVTLRRGS